MPEFKLPPITINNGDFSIEQLDFDPKSYSPIKII
ncbi:hypothetical protein Mucpa_3088 [Mucilaginibacter paludis DSM 18603]|uniref:Uncharacterized protein n=1 Tax=Mucilaginibacter paludis DSM 18603 TaxID=714943 RepID=H1YEF8_9SPHI|nr:hypothetical protein Mucpa_3088 [Mucilaginibacter paludis DSM 18603]